MPTDEWGVFLFMPLALLLALAAPLLGEDDRTLDYRTIVFKGDGGGTLGVVGGAVRVFPSEGEEWKLRETEKGWTIQHLTTKEKPESRYLSVDSNGSVILVSQPGDGAYWKLTPKCTGVECRATLQVSGGKFDGRYLSSSEEAEQIENAGFKSKSYHVTLSEKPGPSTDLSIYVDGA